MAVFPMTNVSILVDSLAVSGFANQLTLDAQADDLDFTTFSAGGWRTKKPGLATFTASVQGFQDFALTGVDPTFPVSLLGGFDTITVAPTGGAAVADPAFFGSGLLTGLTPLTGAVGDTANFDLGWSGSAQLVRGQMLHPTAARTATGNGTTTTFTTPTASQALYASFHVLSVSGAGSIVFTVQTDDNSGMSSPVTRITSSSFTAVGAGIGSLAGALAGETHIRVVYTITGFTSVTFAVAAGVL
jgi:hypothetical protein